MKLKLIITAAFFMLFFLGETAITFSFKNGSDRNPDEASLLPLSYRISNANTDSSLAVFDTAIAEFMQQYGVVGASVAIAKDGRLVYSKGFGLADKEMLDPVLPRNLFRIASVSKLITAVAVMKLVEDEKLRIDQKVFGPDGILNDSIYLNYSDRRYEEITIGQLLDHTAGWNGKKEDPVLNTLYVSRVMDTPPPATIQTVIEYALNQPLTFEPGTTYCYSNLGYCVLGEVIEKITGARYEDYVQFAILHPLGIYDMHIGKSFFDERFPSEVRYYDQDEDDLVWSYDGSRDLVPIEYGGNDIELLGAAGGWIASAPELAKLMVAIDAFDSRPDILSRNTIEFMTTSKTNNRKLIGWRGSDGNGTWWRTGTLTGTMALIMRQKSDLNWVILLNTTTEKRKKIHNELSRTMFQALRKVKNWPANDLFNPEETIAQSNGQDSY
jgi:CubicO group peptidase (beta-lactamase class C family)